MSDSDHGRHELRLETRAKLLRARLRSLPSAAWAKDETNRKRLRLAAQLRIIEAHLIEGRQIGLFPKKERQKGENA
jgi:hypothetical protein